MYLTPRQIKKLLSRPVVDFYCTSVITLSQALHLEWIAGAIMRLVALAWILISLLPAGQAQDQSLGNVARATRAREAKSPHAAKVFSNEDSGPQEIKDTDDPFDVYKRAGKSLLHDTMHRCVEESAGNSGPGWKKSSTFEVAAGDRMRMIAQEGSSRMEWLLVGDTYYRKDDAGSWRKLSLAEEIALAQRVFPGAGIPQELQFRFEDGELKRAGDQSIGGVPMVLYEYVAHGSDFDRRINLWIGRQNSLPYRMEMRTETRDSLMAPTKWQESVSCTYGVEISIVAPL